MAPIKPTNPDATNQSRPLLLAHASMSGQFHAGLPPTVQSGSGSTSRCRQASTVVRLTPSRSAISEMPTGEQSFMARNRTSECIDNQHGCMDNQHMTQTPEVGRKVRAITTTATSLSVVVEVTAIDAETDAGWYVWGYRKHARDGRRQTLIPRLYFVARSA